MQYQWTGKNINLEMFSQRIQGFLESRGFKTKVDRCSGGWIIMGTIRHDESLHNVRVKVVGSPNDFSVEIFGGERNGFKLLLNAFGQMFGGAFFLRKLKQQEFLEKLESELLVFLDAAVASLSG